MYNNFKSKIFPIKDLDKIPPPEPAPKPSPKLEPDPKVFDTPKSTKVKTKHENSSLKLCEEFWNEIVNDEKQEKQQQKKPWNI